MILLQSFICCIVNIVCPFCITIVSCDIWAFVLHFSILFSVAIFSKILPLSSTYPGAQLRAFTLGLHSVLDSVGWGLPSSLFSRCVSFCLTYKTYKKNMFKVCGTKSGRYCTDLDAYISKKQKVPSKCKMLSQGNNVF